MPRTKLRIGIFAPEFSKLGNWELKIIERIFEDPSLEIVLIIKDGRFLNYGRLGKFLKHRKKISKLIFELQRKIEIILFAKNSFSNFDYISKKLSDIKQIELSPERKGYVDFFNSQDSEIVKSYFLDILIRFEFNIIRGDILESSRYGIWSFHHGDNSFNRGGPPAFWEIFKKEAVVGVTLQKLTSELDGGFVIDKGYYNTHWSFVKTYLNIFEQSSELLFKNIRLLQTTGILSLKKSSVYYNVLYRIPDIKITLRYCIRFYFNLLSKTLEFFDSKFLKKRHNCWTLFIGHGSFIESTLFRLKAIPLPKDKFWADPFLVNWKGDFFVFFEDYSYSEKKGKISVGKIIGNEIVDIHEVISKEYHLSFPNCFWDKGELFMIPETSEAQRLEIYKCVNFPNVWELYSTAFHGEKVVDVIFYRDNNDEQWLFMSSGTNDYYNSELYIYKVDSLKLNEIIPHKKNPVIIDSRVARNGGAIFERDGKLYRPSQNNSNGTYGFGLNINEIIELNLHEYKENTLVSIAPNFKQGMISCHHLHQLDDYFVIDGAFKRY